MLSDIWDSILICFVSTAIPVIAKFQTIFRWQAATVRAISNLRRSWKVLVEDLNKIGYTEPGWPIATKVLAREYLKGLRNRKFLLFLHFQLDIMLQMQRWSEMLQQTRQITIN